MREVMLWIAAGVMVLAASALAAVSAWVGWRLTHPARKEVDDSPESYGLSYEAVAFPSREGGVQLRGWFLPSARKEAGMTLILAHGYAGTRLEKGLPSLALGKSIVEAGFHLLMFDFRNSGESEGAMTTVGFFEKQDLLGAVDWVKARVPGKIGLIGFSMGGSTSILAAAEEEAVAGVVADSSFGQLKTYLQKNLSVWSKLPHFPFTPLILAILPWLTGIRPAQVNAMEAVERVYPRPILFIHSKDDLAIPSSHSEAMWRRHPDAFQLWISSRAGHVGTYRQHAEEYAKRVIAFFSNL